MGELRPVWDGYLADPFILPTPNGYYAYGTDADHQPTYQKTGRHFPVLFSKDLKNWELIGGAVRSDMEGAFWAPEVAFREGKYYIFYSSGDHSGMGQYAQVAIAKSPEGPFLPVHGRMFPDLPFSIDASPFYDPVSKDWFLFFANDFLTDNVGTGISVCRLGSDMKPLATPSTLLRGTQDWQIYERNRHWYGKTWPAWYTLEGPKAIYHQGQYYLFYSGGNWKTKGYGVDFAVAHSVKGPYQPAGNPDGAAVLRSGMAGLRGPGHNSIFTGHDGQERIVFHAWDHEMVKRQMHIAHLKWNAMAEPEVDFIS